MTRLLTLVLSSASDPYIRILEEGQEPTWISSARALGNQVFPYLSAGSGQSASALNVEKLFDRHEFINRIGANRWRHVRNEPGKLSRELIACNKSQFRLDQRRSRLVSEGRDSLALIGLRTLEAFRFVLENYEFEFLARTNTSSYINVEKLRSFLPSKVRSGQVFALQGRWGKFQYPSGALYVCSRQDLELVVESSALWQHEYIDDVALGLLLRRVVPNLTYIDIPRFEFPFHPDVEPLVSNANSAAHFRCKSSDWRETVRRMHRLNACHSQ